MTYTESAVSYSLEDQIKFISFYSPKIPKIR